MSSGSTTDYDVVVIGAGPYGLSAAAHLQAVKGLRLRVFGNPMSFWKLHMPATMLLRSPWQGCHLSDPNCALKFDAYFDKKRQSIVSPVPLKDFIAYGNWFQRQAIGDVDSRTVHSVETGSTGFRIVVSDGECIRTRQVIVATGIATFAYSPEHLSGLPRNLVSHSSDHCDFSSFSGKRVAVIGSGQSALESAASLYEIGSHVEVIARATQLFWTWKRPFLHTFQPLAKLLFAPPDVGPAFVSHIIARPNLYRSLPRSVQDRWAEHTMGASVARWLMPRLTGIRITYGRQIASSSPDGGGHLRISLDDGTERVVDHLIMATGYRVDVSRYSFLSPRVLSLVERVGGYPRLNAGFESTLPGLFFLGAPAAWSFGPLLRFVAGAEFAAPRVAQWASARSGAGWSRNGNGTPEFATA